MGRSNVTETQRALCLRGDKYRYFTSGVDFSSYGKLIDHLNTSLCSDSVYAPYDSPTEVLRNGDRVSQRQPGICRAEVVEDRCGPGDGQCYGPGCRQPACYQLKSPGFPDFRGQDRAENPLLLKRSDAYKSGTGLRHEPEHGKETGLCP